MKRLALLLAFAASPAAAGQCPDGRWMDKMEYCNRPTPVFCDGKYRDRLEQCPEARRPVPNPRRSATPATGE